MQTAIPQRFDARVKIRGRWVANPVDMLCDKNLSRNARLTMAVLYAYASNKDATDPTQEELAEILLTKPRIVRRWILELYNSGYVEVQRTMRGNVYDLLEPHETLTNRIERAYSNRIEESYSHGTPESSPHGTLRSSPTYIKEESPSENHHHQEAPNGHGAGGGGTTRLGQDGATATGEYLRDLGITAWQDLAEQLAGVPHERVQNRVRLLLGEGATLGAVVSNLRKVPFPNRPMEDYPNFFRGDDISDLPPDLDQEESI